MVIGHNPTCTNTLVFAAVGPGALPICLKALAISAILGFQTAFSSIIQWPNLFYIVQN